MIPWETQRTWLLKVMQILYFKALFNPYIYIQSTVFHDYGRLLLLQNALHCKHMTLRRCLWVFDGTDCKKGKKEKIAEGKEKRQSRGKKKLCSINLL